MPHITGYTHAQCKSEDQQSREGVKGREKMGRGRHWRKRGEEKEKEEERGMERIKEREEEEGEKEGEGEEEWEESRGRGGGTGWEKRNERQERRGRGRRKGKKEVEGEESVPHCKMLSQCTPWAKPRRNISPTDGAAVCPHFHPPVVNQESLTTTEGVTEKSTKHRASPLINLGTTRSLQNLRKAVSSSGPY